MQKYNSLRAPNPDEWLALDEGERLELVREHHEELGTDLPSPDAHAVFHTIIENQIAAGEELPVKSTLDRLISEGLDRHEAIHAIASVLAGHIHDIMQNPAANKGQTEHTEYFQALKQLTAQSWFEQE